MTCPMSVPAIPRKTPHSVLYDLGVCSIVGPWCVLSLGEMLASLAADDGFVPPYALAENGEEPVDVSLPLIHLLGGKGKWLVAQVAGGGEPLDGHAS